VKFSLLILCITRRNGLEKSQVGGPTSIGCRSSITHGELLGTFKFTYDGKRLQAQDTPVDVSVLLMTIGRSYADT
jgi:hypothetical protein